MMAAGASRWRYLGWQLDAFWVIFLPLCAVPITSVSLTVYKPPNCFCSGCMVQMQDELWRDLILA